MNVQLATQAEARVAAAALQNGVDINTVLERLVTEHLPPVELNGLAGTNGKSATHGPLIDEENAAALAFLESIIADAPTDPEEQRIADEEFRSFMRIVHADRTFEGEMPI